MDEYTKSLYFELFYSIGTEHACYWAATEWFCGQCMRVFKNKLDMARMHCHCCRDDVCSDCYFNNNAWREAPYNVHRAGDKKKYFYAREQYQTLVDEDELPVEGFFLASQKELLYVRRYRYADDPGLMSDKLYDLLKTMLDRMLQVNPKLTWHEYYQRLILANPRRLGAWEYLRSLSRTVYDNAWMHL